jgi:hypothetical protein
MGFLQQITKGGTSLPRRAMLHGVQGVGKSSWAATSRRPIFIPTEDGLGGIACDRFPLMRSTQEVMDALDELRSQEHDYATVVIDSLDWLERMIFDDVCGEFGVKYLEKADGGYGKGYTYTLPRWRKILDKLDALRLDRSMAVILLAHTKSEKFQTPEDAAYDRFAPRLHKLASALVQEWCDEVFFATYSSITDPKKVRGQAPDRVMRTCEGPTHVAKNRLGMPPELPLEWAAYDYFANLAAAGQGETNLSPNPENGEVTHG